MSQFPKIAAILIVAISGSVLRADTGQKTYGPPAPREVANQTQPAEPTLPTGIPAILGEVVEIAAATHPTVQQAAAQMRARRSELRGAKWLSYPSLSVEALAITKGSAASDQNGIAANLTLEQPIWAGGKIAGTIDRARAVWQASSTGVTEASLAIALKATQAYFALALTAKQEQILTSSLEQHRVLLDTIKRRVDQEVSPRADLELAMSRAAQIELDLAAVKGQRATAYNQLMELINYQAIDLGDVPVHRAEYVLPEENTLVQQAHACDPTLEKLRFELAAAEADRKIAKGALFPQLVGQVTHNEFTGTRAGLALRLQTGNGLSQYSAVGTAGARIDAANYQIATAERQLREQIRTDFVAYGAARARLSAGTQATLSSMIVTESYKRQFIAGRRTWLDVMNAVREAMSAELSEADAEVTAMSAASRLYLRSCAWKPNGPLRDTGN